MEKANIYMSTLSYIWVSLIINKVKYVFKYLLVIWVFNYLIYGLCPTFFLKGVCILFFLLTLKAHYIFNILTLCYIIPTFFQML